MERPVSYLVRAEDSDGTSLQFFSYDEKFDIAAEGQLIAYLTSVIELNRYATGPAVVGVWRWNPDDTRDEMHLNLTETRPEMESWQDEVWTVTSLAGEEEGIEFIVSIDLKGQQ